jgi:hypothetical protein
MASTIPASFQELRSNLEISGLQKSTVSTRQQNVRQAIANELDVLDSFLTGSYSRSTLIAPLTEADIDIFIVLSPKYFHECTAASLLDKVRNVLLKAYQTPKISRNGQAVTITFSDFRVDVVPAFNRQGGGYLIPNSITNSFISTNPKTHVELMTYENIQHNQALIPLVKMIKGWNKNINDAFVSFYLELMVMNILKGITISDFPSGMRYFFDKGREAIKYTITDPAGYGGSLSGLRNVLTVDEAVSRFQTAYGRARKAEEYAANSYIAAAVDEWKKIFGNYFPSYG